VSISAVDGGGVDLKRADPFLEIKHERAGCQKKTSCQKKKFAKFRSKFFLTGCQKKSTSGQKVFF
jgi:hypothetical protein